MTPVEKRNEYLKGQILIAMPNMPDPRFSQTVIYVCAHNSEGAMGLVVNRPLGSPAYLSLMEQLDIDVSKASRKIDMLFGGPVEMDRGFVLHSSDYYKDTTMLVDKEIALTGTVDILRDIVAGRGPKDHLVALGYSGWGPGQLDNEIKGNGWLNVNADKTLLFDSDPADKWQRAMKKLGIDPLMLSDDTGNA